MEAEIKRLHSPDVDDVYQYVASGPFCLLVQLFIGPKNAQGEESFDLTVCSPSWLALQNKPMISGEYMLIMKEFSSRAILNFVQLALNEIRGDSWAQIAQKLGRIAKWEFQDYTP